MEIRKVLALRGPNMWANFPVLEAWVDLGELKDSSSTSIPGFNDRLMSWLPTMIEHCCSEGVRGGFFQRLREGTYPAHILEHVTLELQELLGMPVKYGRAREMKEDSSVYKVVVQYREEAVGRACLSAARELVLAAIHDRPVDRRAGGDQAPVRQPGARRGDQPVDPRAGRGRLPQRPRAGRRGGGRAVRAGGRLPRPGDRRQGRRRLEARARPRHRRRLEH